MNYFFNSYFNSKKKIIIFQASPIGTGSTLLVNILYGLICSEKPINFDYGFLELLEKKQTTLDVYKNFEKNFLSNNVNIVKTNNLNLELISNTFSKKYDLFFVCSERDKLKIDSKYYKQKNIVIFNYDDLLETNENRIENIINFIKDKIYFILPKTIELNEKNAIVRIKNMNSLYEFIKEKPITYVDNFYHMHGSDHSRMLNP